MPIQLRPRLTCHYCGRRSKLSKKEGRRFQCDFCLAVNFFDEHGEIADVPVEETAPPPHLAQSTTRDPLADEFSNGDTVFCSTCLKYQHLYTTTLSQFLPDPDDPEYDQIEAQLPAFKKGLEERYPQCCAKCEPKVRAQLQKATYNAKSDHIRRVLDKSRQRRIASRWGWRSLLVSAAGLGYALSISVQVAWHLYGSQIQPSPILGTLRLSQCLGQRPLNEQCLNMMERFVGLSLGLGLLCVWWNPKWQHKLSNNEGKLVGLEKYYLIQLAILLSRFAAWAVLQDVPFNIRLTTMIHALFAVLTVAVALWSNFGIIQVRLASPIDWNMDPAPLLSKTQFVPPKIDSLPQSTMAQDRAFGLNNLASATMPSYETWRPPTPPTEYGDSMDWTPSQPAFEPQPKTIHYLSAGPSPFHGRLPALTAKGIQTQSYRAPNEPKEAIGLPPGFFDRKANSILPPRQQNVTGEAMAQPTFFGHERQADTGLENIFETVFSFQDRNVGPATRSSVTRTHNSRHIAEKHQAGPEQLTLPYAVSIQLIISGIAFFVLLIALMTWLLEIAVKPNGSSLGYYIVMASASIPTIHFLHDTFTGRVRGRLLWLLVFATEASSLVGLAFARDLFEGAYRDLWNKLAIAAVALLLPQEFVRMTSSSTESGNQPQPGRYSPSAQVARQPVAHPDSFVGQSPVEVANDFNSPLKSAPKPKPQKTAFRRDSDESTTSRTTATSSSTINRWETPDVHRERYDSYEWGNREHRAVTPQRRSEMTSELDGLSLNEAASRNRGAASKHTGTLWDLPSSSSTSTFDSRSRARRGF